MSATRPKPSYEGGKKPPYGQFIDWLDRQVTSLLGANHKTLSEAIQAMIDDSSSAPTAHASSHARSGSDPLDGDVIDIDFAPDNYTPQTVAGLTTSTQELTSHLEGVDDALGDHKTRIDAIEALDVKYRTTWVGGGTNLLGTAASTTYYHHVIGYFEDASPATAIEEKRQLWGLDGTFTALLYQNQESVVDADTYSWTLQINGVDTALAFSGLAPNDTTLHEETASVSVSKGDRIVFKQVVGANALTGNCNPSWWLNFVES